MLPHGDNPRAGGAPLPTFGSLSLRSTKSSVDMLKHGGGELLRSTRSMPDLLRTRSSSSFSGLGGLGGAAASGPTPEQKIKLQKQRSLQIAVMGAKAGLASTKATLAAHAPTDMSPSKIAAEKALLEAEKAVEEACRAWVQASR